MSDLAWMPATELAAAIRGREASPVEAVDAAGGDVLTFMPARLSFPFDAQPRSIRLEMAPWYPWIERHGLSNVELWEALAGHDSAALALDDVHLNAEGQRLLAEVWFESVEPRLRR